MVIEHAEHQRPDAVGVAGADQLLVGEADQGVGALQLAQALDEAVDEAAAPGAGDEVQHHLGVGGRLADRTILDQLMSQRQPVGEVAVVADGEAAALDLGEQRLHVAQNGLAGGGVADVADRRVSGELLDDVGVGEGVADQAETPLGVETAAIEGDDAGGLLAAVLQRVQAERGDGGGVGVAEDAEYAAFLAQRVTIQIVFEPDHLVHSVLRRQRL